MYYIKILYYVNIISIIYLSVSFLIRFTQISFLAVYRRPYVHFGQVQMRATAMWLQGVLCANLLKKYIYLQVFLGFVYIHLHMEQIYPAFMQIIQTAISHFS